MQENVRAWISSFHASRHILTLPQTKNLSAADAVRQVSFDSYIEII